MAGASRQHNPFLRELLALQQDGRQAISAPTNWTRSRPLLEVETELDVTVNELSDACLVAESNSVGRWHFFVGSPGNGKSAAVGRLVQTLIEQKDCRVVDEDGTGIQDLDDVCVPYCLDVYEDGNRFPSVRIVQDASVVRNPYAGGVDPAQDFLDTLRDAWDRGMSLVVCTNRGVMEKAHRDTYLDPQYNRQTWHRAILGPLVDQDNGEESDSGEERDIASLPTAAGRTVFESINAKATFLDNRSLILGGRGVFEKLIEKAVEDREWERCRDCGVAPLCPFKANRDWLADRDGREAVVRALRRAEVLSSQVIVFREALAAISFILAGCARDYPAGDPCAWVHRLHEQGDLFGLASRRLYMSLFCASSPRGLETSADLREEQAKALEDLRSGLPDQGNWAARALAATLDSPAPSTDVGIIRLLGKDGVFAQLDAIQGPLPSKFYDDWAGNYERIQGIADSPYLSELERRCAEAWYLLETTAESMPSHAAASAFWAVRRWSSQFTLRLGTLVEGKAAASDELDEFAELLELLWKDRDSRTTEERRRLRELEELVERLLNRTGGSAGESSGVHLAEHVTVKGRWVDERIRPKVRASPASGSLAVAVEFGGAGSYTTLVASMYLWLRQRAQGTMDPRCIPTDLLGEAMDAKSRATAKSSYAFAPDDVTLEVRGDEESFELSRYDGEVDARVKPRS